MAFHPRDEYVPRRGVAMKVVEPNPNLRTGVQRDAMVDAEASKFVRQEFVLNKAMTAKAPKLTKVKTFGASDVPWAAGNGNVIAPPKPEPKQYRRLIGHRIPEDKMDQYYHSPNVERERHVQQDVMENARNFADNFSPQPGERRHKIHPDTLKATPQGLAVPINGFRGLGAFHRERAEGKGHGVNDATYDPLGMRKWGPRSTGLKRNPDCTAAGEEAHLALRHNDGVAFEDTQKKTFATPHRHCFPQNYGPEQDMQGFRGLGSSDTPGPVHGRRHSPRGNADHDYRNNVAATATAAARDRQAAQAEVGPGPSSSASHHYQQQPPQALAPLSPDKHHRGPQQPSLQHQAGTWSPAGASPSQQPQYRSASSLGLASPQQYSSSSPAKRGGRESAPPGLGNSVHFHPTQH